MRPPSAIGRFAADRRGAAGIELAMVAPFLLSLIFTGCAFFDAIRASYVADKATFTIGDIMSRQIQANDVLFGQMTETLDRLVENDVGRPELRISSLIRTPAGFAVDWTYSSQDGPLSSTAIPTDGLPDIAVNDSVIVTETRIRLQPLFNLVPLAGDNHLKFYHLAVTRPRFVGRVANEE